MTVYFDTGSCFTFEPLLTRHYIRLTSVTSISTGDQHYSYHFAKAPASKMPVTIKINADLAPECCRSRDAPTTAREALFQTASGTRKSVKELLQTSIKDSELPYMFCTSNGFVYGCLEAYNQHHNLVIRPDDVWLTIMAQFAVYVDKNHEMMREHFIGGKKGKKQLTVRATDCQGSVDFGAMAEQMAELLEVRIAICRSAWAVWLTSQSIIWKTRNLRVGSYPASQRRRPQIRLRALSC
jgi:hypothetical protein